MFNLSENLSNLRRSHNVTQEELANFVGVTKASVSKWETGVSTPDLSLLPLLASYFNVTVGELIGYEPQLSKEQIRKIYHDFTVEFAEKPWAEVMEKSRKLVKKYYSCYPFLAQICVLWLNHCLELAPEEKLLVMEEIGELCMRILENCRDAGLCSDVRNLRALIDLQRGRPADVIEALEEVLSPLHNSFQNEAVLTQAYQMNGQPEKAESYTQIMLFWHMMALVGEMAQYMMFHAAEPEKTEEAIARADAIAEAFRMKKLHPNALAEFEYQAALLYCMQAQPEKALDRLEQFTECCQELFSGELILHGDAFFDRIDCWIEELDLGTQSVRDRRKVAESLPTLLANPMFAPFEGNARFEKMKKKLLKLK